MKTTGIVDYTNGLGAQAKDVMLARCVLSRGGSDTAVKQQDKNVVN